MMKKSLVFLPLLLAFSLPVSAEARFPQPDSQPTNVNVRSLDDRVQIQPVGEPRLLRNLENPDEFDLIVEVEGKPATMTITRDRKIKKISGKSGEYGVVKKPRDKKPREGKSRY